MKKIIGLLVSLAPLSAFAQVTGQLDTINKVTDKFTSLGNTFVTILISLSVIWIIYSIVRYLIAGGKGGEERAKGGMNILWGVVGLVLIFSIWGLVNLLRNSFQTNNSVVQEGKPQVLPIIPQVNP